MAAMFSKPKKPDTSLAEKQLAMTEEDNEKLEAQNKARVRNSRGRSGGYSRDTAFQGRLGANAGSSVTGLSKNLGVAS